MPDGQKKYSLVDNAFKGFSQQLTETTSPLSTSLLPSDNSLLSKLTALQEEQKQQQDKLPPDTSINLQGGSVTFDLTFPSGTKEKLTPRTDIQTTSGLDSLLQPVVADNTSRVKSDLETKANRQFFQTDKGFIHKVRTNQAENVKNIGNKSALRNSLEQGFYEGIKQNVELNTGLDVETKYDPISMSYEDLNTLYNEGYISQGELQNYLKHRNQLPLLTSITASLVNSVLIAGEIGVTAPAKGIELSAKGVKFLSKEGLKRWGAEVWQQGKNSYRVMGAGGNIRAGREGWQEVEDKNLTDLDDIVITLGKHAIKNNVQSLMEGMSEGMIREMKYADVPLMGLVTGSKKAWLSLMENTSRKAISGLLYETGTEQITDLVTDITSGENVFKQGSNFVNILTGETSAVRKAALENLFIEAVTGFALGSTMGRRDFIRRSVEAKMQDKIDKGLITKEQGEAVLEAAQEQGVINKAIEKIVDKNKRSAWSETSKDVSHGLDVFKNFGSKLKPELKVDPATQEIHDQSMERMNKDFPKNLAKVSNKMDEITKDTGIQPNALDQVIFMGQENTKSYLSHRGELENTDYETSFAKDDLAYNLPFELQHQITEDVMSNIASTAAVKGITKNLVIPQDMKPELRDQLKQDLLLGTMGGFEDTGFEMIKHKWAEAIGKEAIDNAIASAKALQTPGNRYLGQKSMEIAFQKSKENVDMHYGTKALEEVDLKRQTVSEENDEIDNIASNVPDILNQDTGWRPKRVAMRDETGTVIEGKRGMNHIDMYKGVPGIDEYNHNYEQGFIDWDGTYLTRDQAAEKSGLAGESVTLGLAGKKAQWRVDPELGIAILNEAVAFHGGPHSFDKFSTDKVGTGEGAQSYGYGLYFSSKENIAQWYANKLSNFKEEKEFLEGNIVYIKNIINGTEKAPESFLNENKEYWIEQLKVYEQRLVKLPKRNLYKVTLWEGKEQNLLDWDSELTDEQTKKVIEQAKAEKLDSKINQEELWHITGKYFNYEEGVADSPSSRGAFLYDFLAKQLGSSKLVSEFLNRAGFDGIVYQGDSSGVQNYVVFDDSAVKIEKHTLFQRPQAPGTTSDIFPKYSDLLEDFINSEEPKTIGGLYAFARDNKLINEALLPVFKNLVKHVGDMEVKFDERRDTKGNIIPGGFQPGYDDISSHMLINKLALASQPIDVGNTILHEALHAFTVDFLRSNTPEALEFRSDIDSIRKEVLDVINNPDKAIKNGTWMGTPQELKTLVSSFANDITYYTGTTEEFVAGVFADVTKIRGMMMRIKATAQRPTTNVTTWDKVRNAFKTAWSTLNPIGVNSDSTLFDSLIDVMSKHQANLESFNKARRSNLTTDEVKRLRDLMSNFHAGESGFFPEELEKEPDTERNQEDDDSLEDQLQDVASAKGLVSLVAQLEGMTVPEMRSAIKEFGSRNAFANWLRLRNLKYKGLIDARISELYDQLYKKKQEDPKRFKERFITGTFNSIVNTKSMPHISVRTDRNWNARERRQTSTTTIVKLGDTFKNGDGSTADSFVGTTMLEGFLKPLATFLGLDENTFQLHYVANFESYRDGAFEQRATLGRLTNWLLGNKEYKGPKSKLLGETLYRNGYLYLGNFGGRNTSPALFIPEQHRTAVARALEAAAEQYGNKFNSDANYGQTARLLLEDMWYGSKATNIKELKDNSIVLTKNINKVWKRGMKFLTKVNQTWQNAEHINKVLNGKPLHGIAFKNGEIEVRAAVFSSDDKGNFTIKIGDELITIPAAELLRNADPQQHTERTDGASFYLFGELDEIYHEIHGTLKDGTIKNVYASKYGEKPLYIKHAMHGVNPNSVLGKFMKKHNIGLLISDTAQKEVAVDPINLSDFNDGQEEIPKENILDLKLGNFQRIKEELGTNTLAGTIKQWLNGSGHGSYSSVIEASDFDGKYDEHLQDLSQKMVGNAQDKLIEQAKPEALYHTLKGMVERPNSPREEAISKAFKDIARLPMQEFLDNFGNIFNFPMVSESLRQRLFRTLSTALQGRVSGMRSCLRTDPGMLNAPAGYDLIKSDKNLDKHLLSFMEEDGIMSEVFPEPGLAKLALRFLELQRLESIAQAKEDFKKINSLRTERENILDEIDAIGVSDATTEARKKIFAASGGNIYRLIDKTNPKLETWKNNKLKDLVNPNGTLKEDWSVISEDQANLQGLKVGDYFIANVTPTDSPLGIIAGRVAAIAPTYKGKDGKRKVADRMSVMMNSEYIQSIVGKDFDIDTISILGFDPEYWTREQFNAVWKTIKTARNKFVDKVTTTARAVLDNQDITKEQAFTGDIREQYMQQLMGKTDSQSFDAIDNFWEMNDAYLVDPSKIITERLYHTALSAINFRSKLFGRILNVRHPGWFRTHLMHLIDTNFSVDFPGQLSKLTYVGPDTKQESALLPSYADIMHTHTFGSYSLQMSGKEEVKVTNKVIRFLFSTAFDLAAGRDLELEVKPDYYRLKGQIEKQQNLLRLLDANTPQSKSELARLFNDTLDKDLAEIEKLYGNTHKKYEAAQQANEQFKEIATQLLENMEIGSVADYPLFTSILNIDTKALPMPGSSYKDWLIDQTLLAQDLLNGNAKLTQIMNDQILGEATTFKKGTFTQEKTFVNRAAWDIVKFAGLRVGQNQTAMEKLDALLVNAEATAEMFGGISPQHLGKLRYMLQEYSAMRSLVGKPYPVDAVRDGKEWGITHQSIALSLLPKQLDFSANRNKLDYENNLEGAQAEIIAILHAFIEPEITGNMASDVLRSYWHGREVSFPMLMKALLDKPKVTFSAPLSVQLTLKGQKVLFSQNSHHQLVVKIGDEAYTHDKLKAATEGPAADIYHALTERGGFFEGNAENTEGLKNRQELSKLINFNDNTKPEERLDLLTNHILKRLYSSKNGFSNTERQGLWISFFGYSTNLAIRDNKVQGLSIRKDMFNEVDAMNYRANEVLYQLLARFEPQLFNRTMMSYSDVTSSTDRVQKDMGIVATRSSSLSVPMVLNQQVMDESQPNRNNNVTFDLVSEEIRELSTSPTYRELKKVLKDRGFQGGLNYLRTMVSNTRIKQALASSQIWYGDLVNDIKNSSARELTAKYGPNAASKIHEIIRNEVSDIGTTDQFLQERVVEQGNDIAAIKAIFLQLKAMDKLAEKSDNNIQSRFKKLLLGKISYNLIAPMKEKKVHAFKSKNTVIGHIFRFEGVSDLSVGDMESFNKSYNTQIYDGVGESSIGIRKSQELNMALNRHHAELAGEVGSMEFIFSLLLDSDKRNEFMTGEATTENVPRVDTLKRIIPQIDQNDSNLLLLRKEIFNLAENLHKNAGVEIVIDEIGRHFYRQGDYFNYDKYKFINDLPDTDALGKIKILAALDIRELYDVKVPELIKKGLNYIDRARLDLIATNDTETLIELDALRDRYNEYLIAMQKKRGVYMPHMYSHDTYKFLWANQYRDYIVKQLKEQHPELDRKGKEFGKLVMKAVDTKYAEVMVGEASSYTIPNFLPRRNPEDDSYKRATIDMHFSYIGQLINGLKHDMLYSDWLTYRSRARNNGERTSLIEMTKLWYADQMRNKMLHTKDVEVGDISRGMQINFLKKGFTYSSENQVPIEGDLQVWGIVEKVDKRNDLLILKLDRDRIKFDTKNDLDAARGYLEKIGPETSKMPASDRQIFHIKALVKKGYLKPEDISTDISGSLADLTKRQALELTVKGLQRLLDNIDTLGHYKLSEVYSKNVRGGHAAKVNRYTRRGSLEYLDMKRREAKNLQNTVGEYDHSIDDIAYKAWTGAVWGGNMVSTVPKTILGLLTMGLMAAPNALSTNWWGALMSNHADAPYTNFYKYRKEGKAQWKGFQKKTRDAMNASQREWYDLFTSLGLGSNKDLVAISLEAGNISMLDVLSDKGFAGGVRYLSAAIKSGGEFKTYHNNMDDLRRQYLVADSTNERANLLNKMSRETQAWRAKVEGRIKSYAKATTPTKEEIAVQQRLNPTVTDQALLTQYARSQKLIDLSARRAAEIQREKEAGTFKEPVNVAVEEQMDRTQSSKLLAKFVGTRFFRGPLGLGLQALAEVQRRPAFYIGYRTAIDMGYSREEAIQYGVSAVEYRHAFYGPSYRQFDANTKLGAFLQQYVQYTWNNFSKWLVNIKQALPQFLREWERAGARDKNFIQKVWTTMFKRSFTNLNEAGTKQLSHGPNSDVNALEDVNILHRLLAKWTINMMINQAGSRLFYGITNWSDPMVQLTYKFMDLFTDKAAGLIGEPPEREDGWLQTMNQIVEAFFFLGLPYKLVSQYLFSAPDEDLTDVYIKGRIEDHIEVVDRLENEYAILSGELSPYVANATKRKRLLDIKQIPWFVDDFLLGAKILSWAYPDSPQQGYIKNQLYPTLDWTPPFLGLERQAKYIKINNRARYVNTHGNGIDFGDRVVRTVLEAPKTFIPFFDKLWDYKPTK